MKPRVCLTPLDADYPSRLRSLPRPPASITVEGGSLEAERAVAVVGSREADSCAVDFARRLAATLVEAGAVVVSGGAVGIDAAAHRGALDAGGRTWAVAGTGCHACFPSVHAGLFDEIARGPGAMVWPFSASASFARGAFVRRNRILVALADAVVVAQAGARSGALRAAACARELGRPLWVVPAPPWLQRFEGSRQLLASGARPFTGTDDFLRSLDLAASSRDAARAGAPAARSEDARLEAEPSAGASRSDLERAVLRATSAAACHTDEIAARAHVAAQATAAALLTLALEAVVVEGPPGFFRRRDNGNR